MATLSTFKGALKYGGARSNLFQIEISSPLATFTEAQFHCNTSEIPGLTVTPIEKLYFGRTVKFPGELTFGTLATSFINPESYGVRKSLEEWTDALNGPVDNLGISGRVQEWAGTVTLTQFGKDGNANQTWSFIDCWPSSVSAIELNYDTVGDMETFDVTWSYNYFTSINTKDPGVGAIQT